MTWTNRLVGLGLVAFAAFLLPYTDRFPGAAADFPRLLIWVIIGLSVVMIARSFIPNMVRVSTAEGSASPVKMIRPLVVAGALAVAVVLMQTIGFYPAMALLGVALMGVLGAPRPVLFLATIAGLLLFVLLLFQLALGVPLDSLGTWS